MNNLIQLEKECINTFEKDILVLEKEISKRKQKFASRIRELDYLKNNLPEDLRHLGFFGFLPEEIKIFILKMILNKFKHKISTKLKMVCKQFYNLINKTYSKCGILYSDLKDYYGLEEELNNSAWISILKLKDACSEVGDYHYLNNIFINNINENILWLFPINKTWVLFNSGTNRGMHKMNADHGVFWELRGLEKDLRMKYDHGKHTSFSFCLNFKTLTKGKIKINFRADALISGCYNILDCKYKINKSSEGLVFKNNNQTIEISHEISHGIYIPMDKIKYNYFKISQKRFRFAFKGHYPLRLFLYNKSKGALKIFKELFDIKNFYEIFCSNGYLLINHKISFPLS